MDTNYGICPKTGRPHTVRSECFDAYCRDYTVWCDDCHEILEMTTIEKGLAIKIGELSRDIGEVEIKNTVDGNTPPRLERSLAKAKEALGDASTLIALTPDPDSENELPRSEDGHVISVWQAYQIELKKSRLERGEPF